MNLSGSIIINLLTPLVLWILQLILIKLAKKYWEIKIFRIIGVWLGKINILISVTSLYMSCFLELTFSALISIIGQNNFGFNKSNTSNNVSASFMLISLFIMISLIFSNLYSAINYRDKMDIPEIKDKYKFIYQGLKTNRIMTAIYPIIFMIRRVIFVLIIILMYEYSGLQILLNLLLTMAMIFYIIKFMP